ncbi:hypothetical protein B0H14DRAFT_2576419 [Mycena olivaceomarginata]|nr:hypothetical protein B0H14DRAFT_2576419 [Mycena olivaceomarginata]
MPFKKTTTVDLQKGEHIVDVNNFKLNRRAYYEPPQDDGLTQYDGKHGEHGERHWPEHQTAQENHGMQEGKGKGGPVQSDAADGVEQCIKEAPTELIEFTSRRKASMM